MTRIEALCFSAVRFGSGLWTRHAELFKEAVCLSFILSASVLTIPYCVRFLYFTFEDWELRVVLVPLITRDWPSKSCVGLMLVRLLPKYLDRVFFGVERRSDCRLCMW